jgi:hypothetical protein
MMVIVWLAILLVVASAVIAGCGDSAPADLEEGPGMLYFYAEW